MKILFVCHSNTNRSISAEIILKTLLRRDPVLKGADIKVDSAGVTLGKKSDMRKLTVEELEKLGYSAEHDSFKQVTEEMIKESDYVFFVDFSVFKDLFKKFPKYNSKYTLITKYLKSKENIDKSCKTRDGIIICDPSVNMTKLLPISFDILIRSCEGIIENLVKKEEINE